MRSFKTNMAGRVLSVVLSFAILMTIGIVLPANADGNAQPEPNHLAFFGSSTSKFDGTDVIHTVQIELGYEDDDNINWEDEIKKVTLTLDGPGKDFVFEDIAGKDSWIGFNSDRMQATHTEGRYLDVDVKQTGSGYCTLKVETANGLTAERVLYFEDYKPDGASFAYDQFGMRTLTSILPKPTDSVVYSKYSFSYEYRNDDMIAREDYRLSESANTRFFFSDESMAEAGEPDDRYRIPFTGKKEGVLTVFAVAPNGLAASAEFEIKAYYPEANTDTVKDTDTATETDTATQSDTDTNNDKFGDLDGNGKVTAADSLKIQRYLVNLDRFSDLQLKLADVNQDSKVNSKDVLAILRFTLGFKDKGTAFA